MGKRATQERIKAGEAIVSTAGFRVAGSVPTLFEEHYRLAIRSMTPSHAAAIAHDAVQRHLASLKESEEADRMA